MFDFIKQQHAHLSERDLLVTILANQFFIIQKLENFMTKAEFLQAMADFKTELGVVSGKVDVLETKINSAPTDVDPEIVTAFQDLKSSLDTLNTKADNTAAAATASTTTGA